MSPPLTVRIPPSIVRGAITLINCVVRLCRYVTWPRAHDEHAATHEKDDTYHTEERERETVGPEKISNFFIERISNFVRPPQRRWTIILSKVERRRSIMPWVVILPFLSLWLCPVVKVRVVPSLALSPFCVPEESEKITT